MKLSLLLSYESRSKAEEILMKIDGILKKSVGIVINDANIHNHSFSTVYDGISSRFLLNCPFMTKYPPVFF
jgi:hypothetical protein